MSIHAITGVMGSGKSHEAIKEKVATALAADDTRRVVTNIEGLNYEAIAEYVKKSLDNIKSRLVSVTYERVAEPKFWYDPESGVSDSIVQPGDLVVLDEMWRYFNRGAKLPDDAMRFFRMHRHYADATTGQTCDVVLINQAMRGIHQDIRDVIEVQFNCRKMKSLGLSKFYQVFVIEGNDRKPSHDFKRKYDAKVFPLYSSYSVKDAKESVDKRQSALSTGFFRIVIPGALLGICAGAYGLYNYFDSMGKVDPLTGKPLASATTPSASPSAPVATGPAPVSAPAAAPGATPPAPASTGPLGGSVDGWRIVARYSVGSLPVVVLVDEKGRYRSLTTADYAFGAASNDLTIKPPKDDSRLTTWATYAKTGGVK
jgi:zona occludens toxin